MDTTIDPQVKNLVSAIGKAETGNPTPDAYTKKGASGEYGRYQFMPETWKLWAKEQLGDENAPMTVENQNKVAYNKVKAWKDQGLSPAQIASKWNSGDENAYKTQTPGKNSLGVSYDTPSYALKVSNYYKELSQGTQSEDLNTDSQQTGTQKVAGVLGNIFPGKEIGEGLAAHGVKRDIASNKIGIQYPDYSKLTPEAIAKLKAEGVPTTKEGQMSENENNVSSPTGAQIAGDLGSAALSLVPGAEGVEGLSTGLKIAGGAALGAGIGTMGAVAGGATKASEILPQTAIGGLVGGALTGAGEAIGAAYKGIRGAVNQKTEAEIAQMASNPNITHEEVASLSPTERNRYMDMKSEEITKQADQAKEVRDSIIQQDKERITKENTELQTKLDETKNKQAIELKPLAKQALQDNSNLFMEKVENGFAEGTNLKTKISSFELEDLVNQIKDPEQQALARKQFGLDELIGETETTGRPTAKDITLKDVWDKSKSMRQSLRGSAQNGSRVFTSQEYATVKNTQLLTQFLQDKGMDLTEANQFWTQWSKLRGRIIGEVKPFDTEGVAKMPIESTIEQASKPIAKGYTQAKNFISQLEKQTNLPEGSITADTEKILQKIDKNKLEKANLPDLAKRINDRIKADKTLADASLDSEKFTVQQIVDKKNRINRIILNVLKSAGFIGLGYEGVKHIL